jgi:FKBP-type peptidyl-prolyl cis-trans isomerase SlyD
MIVEENHIIELSYELRDGGPEGELLERMDVNYPFKFFFGGGKLLPAFEDKLYGLREGQCFEFILWPEEAYGPALPANIVELPRHLFDQAPNAVVKDGYVALVDEHGERHHGKIVEVSEEKVAVDLNHAMAGKTLYFKGVVLHIRPATVDELIRQHYIEENGFHAPELDY